MRMQHDLGNAFFKHFILEKTSYWKDSDQGELTSARAKTPLDYLVNLHIISYKLKLKICE